MDAQRQTQGWGTDCRRAIGHALIHDATGVMSAAQFAEATGKDPSNLKKAADALVGEELLERRNPPAAPAGRRGPRTRCSYCFAPGEKQSFEESFGGSPPGALDPGDQLVFVDAERPDNDLFGCLLEARAAGQPQWSALCDGNPQELMIAFRGPQAVDASLDLMAAFSTAKISARRVSVAKIDGPGELTSWASRSRRLRDRADPT